MDYKWLVIFAAIIAIAIGVLVGNGFDSMNDDVYNQSEERSGEKVEKMPIPPAEEGATE